MKQRKINVALSKSLSKQIIQFCIETHNMREILNNFSDESERYGENQIKGLVYSLEKTGLLFSRGRGRGRMYRTTKTGRKVNWNGS